MTLQQQATTAPFTAATLMTIPVSFRTQWNGGDYPAYEFNHAAHAYVEAGQRLRLSIFGGVGWGNAGQVTITGQLVNVP